MKIKFVIKKIDKLYEHGNNKWSVAYHTAKGGLHHEIENAITFETYSEAETMISNFTYPGVYQIDKIFIIV